MLLNARGDRSRLLPSRARPIDLRRALLMHVGPGVDLDRRARPRPADHRLERLAISRHDRRAARSSRARRPLERRPAGDLGSPLMTYLSLPQKVWTESTEHRGLPRSAANAMLVDRRHLAGFRMSDATICSVIRDPAPPVVSDGTAKTRTPFTVEQQLDARKPQLHRRKPVGAPTTRRVSSACSLPLKRRPRSPTTRGRHPLAPDPHGAESTPWASAISSNTGKICSLTACSTEPIASTPSKVASALRASHRNSACCN